MVGGINKKHNKGTTTWTLTAAVQQRTISPISRDVTWKIRRVVCAIAKDKMPSSDTPGDMQCIRSGQQKQKASMKTNKWSDDGWRSVRILLIRYVDVPHTQVHTWCAQCHLVSASLDGIFHLFFSFFGGQERRKRRIRRLSDGSTDSV